MSRGALKTVLDGAAAFVNYIEKPLLTCPLNWEMRDSKNNV